MTFLTVFFFPCTAGQCAALTRASVHPRHLCRLLNSGTYIRPHAQSRGASCRISVCSVIPPFFYFLHTRARRSLLVFRRHRTTVRVVLAPFCASFHCLPPIYCSAIITVLPRIFVFEAVITTFVLRGTGTEARYCRYLLLVTWHVLIFFRLPFRLSLLS